MEKQECPGTTFVLCTLCSTFLYAICAGFRDNFGIMLPAIVAERGLSYATVSFIIALGQLFFGLMQPVFGFLSVRKSPRFVLFSGIFLMLAGLAISAVTQSASLLTIAMGILLPSGTAAASFGIIMSCLLPVFSDRQAHTASGFIAAGIGLSICLLAPLLQYSLASRGLVTTLFLLGTPIILLVPVAIFLTHVGKAAMKVVENTKESFADMLRLAAATPAYRRVSFGFFTCGFHMALIQTHLFSQLTAFGIPDRLASWGLSVYGLGVIAGSISSGMACRRFPMERILGCLYSSRCLWVALLLVPLPYWALFAVIFCLGLTGVATVAPTSNLIGSLFGTRRLATLFGFTYLLHQIGAFCSAWSGGLCLRYTGDYSGIWYADIVLCFLAGAACLSLRSAEQKQTGCGE